MNHLEGAFIKIGPVAPWAGLAVSLSTVNQVLQTISLSIGIAVGVIGLIVTLKKLKATK